MLPPVVILLKNLHAKSGDRRDMGLIPGWGRSSGGGHGNPFQYSCMENPMDRGAWQAMVHEVARVGHDLATKPPLIYISLYFLFQHIIGLSKTEFVGHH